ncbi:hypothetical protein [Marinobacter sp.]|jgi:hypothetical protein|uniref:hypothetical protein n=1 Tax=Marinobacter sp. TaxID=50741 RepID=UPI002639763B|nr:hypothetical protein [Marinobacter sp.]
MDESKDYLRCTYISAEYRHSATGWGIFLARDAEGQLLSLCGTLEQPPLPGESLTAEGVWSRFKTKGVTFAFDTLRAVAPRDPAYFPQYLAAIGDIPTPTAELIVSTFGKSTLLILSRSPDKLDSIQGVSDAHKQRLLARWRERRQQDHLEDELLSSGLNPDLLLELSHRLPADIALKDVLSKDPWLTYIFSKTPFYQVREFIEATGSIEVGRYVEAGIVAAARRGLMTGQTTVSMAELKKLLGPLMGLKARVSDERVQQAFEWLESEKILQVSSDSHFALQEYVDDRDSVLSMLADHQQTENEVTDQISTAQLEKLIKSDQELEDLESSAEALLKFIGRKVYLVDAPHPLLSRKYTQLLKVIESALHLDSFHLHGNYARADDPADDSLAFLQRSDSAPPQRGPADPIDADLIIVHDAHLLTITDWTDLLPAVDSSSNLVLIANLKATALQVYGSPIQCLADALPVLSFADYCRNDPRPGLQQVLSIIEGTWKHANDASDFDFDLPLLSIECSDKEIPEVVQELCFGELPEALGCSVKGDTQVLAPRPKTKPQLAKLREVETKYAEAFKAAWGRQEVYRGILKSPLSRFDVPHYLSGTLEQDDNADVFFHVGASKLKLHPAEARHIAHNYVGHIPTSQQMHYPIIVVVLQSTETMSPGELLAAMQCSQRWTFLVGEPVNITNQGGDTHQ